MNFLRTFFASFIIISLFLPPDSFSSTREEEPVVASLVAPSGVVNNEIITVFRETLKAHGCLTLLPDHYQDTSQAPYQYHAESDKVRVKLFVDAHNGDAQVIWALRGGYGTQAVARALKTVPIDHTSPKTLVGFSDFTLLGLYCHSAFGDHFLHAPMYYAIETHDVSKVGIGSGTPLKSVTDILKGEVSQLTYMLRPLNDKAKEVTLEDAPILGGNLSVIQRNAFGLLKTLSFDVSILFLEDTTKDVKRLENILYGLFDSGRFDRIQGVFIGNLPLTGGSFEEFMDRFKSYLLTDLGLDIPLYYEEGFGHGLKNNPLPMGTSAHIEPTDFGSRLVVQTFKTEKG